MMYTPQQVEDFYKMCEYYGDDVRAAAIFLYLEEKGEHAAMPSRYIDVEMGDDGLTYAILENSNGELKRYLESECEALAQKLSEYSDVL